MDAQWLACLSWRVVPTLKKAIDAFIASTQEAVNGEYTIELYKGTLLSLRLIPSGLFFPISDQSTAPALIRKSAHPPLTTRHPLRIDRSTHQLAGIPQEEV